MSWLFFLACLVLVSCSSGSREVLGGVVRAAGLVDPPPLPVLVVNVGCDPSSLACAPNRLRAVLTWALAGVVNRPGSRVRLFWLGRDLGSTALVLEQVSPETLAAPLSVVRARQDSWQQEALGRFARAAMPLWGRTNGQSPLVDAMAAVASFDGAPGGTLQVWLTDLRSEGGTLGDAFECGDLPAPEVWARRARPLLAGLRGTVVIAAYVSPLERVENGRCPITPARHERLLRLWAAALKNVGARFVVAADAIPQPVTSYVGGAQ